MLKLTKCHKCKYYVEPTEYDLMPKCKAFPEGIPLEIFREEVDHEKPYPGDNGIQYEPIEGDK